MSAGMAPLPGVAVMWLTTPSATVTSMVSVLHGALRLVSVPQVDRCRVAVPHTGVNRPTPFSRMAYWLSPSSGKPPAGVSTLPSMVSRASRPRSPVSTPMTSSVVMPGGMPGPWRWPLGTAAFRSTPPAIAGPTGALVCPMLKKSPLTPATASRASAMSDTSSRAATAPGCSRSTATCGLPRSTRRMCARTCPCEVVSVRASYVTPGATCSTTSAALAAAPPELATTTPARSAATSTRDLVRGC